MKKIKNIIFCVITKVPEKIGQRGLKHNCYDSMTVRYKNDYYASIFWESRVADKITRIDYDSRCYALVFYQGELLMLDRENEHETGGQQRKPGKWGLCVRSIQGKITEYHNKHCFMEYELYEDIEDAVKRQKGIMGNHL